MITRWRSLLGALAAGLLLLALPASARAQDRYRVRDLAWDLSRDANQTWNSVQNAWNSSNLSDDNPDARQLYRSLGNFNRRARLFAQQSQRFGRTVPRRSEARLRVIPIES